MSLGEPVKNCFSVLCSLMDFMDTIFFGFQSSMFWRSCLRWKSSKIRCQVWDTLFPWEKLAVMTSLLIVYCGSKDGVYVEILSLPLLMIYLFFLSSNDFSVGFLLFTLCIGFTQPVSAFLFEVVLCKTVDSLCPWEERRSGTSMS